MVKQAVRQSNIYIKINTGDPKFWIRRGLLISGGWDRTSDTRLMKPANRVRRNAPKPLSFRHFTRESTDLQACANACVGYRKMRIFRILLAECGKNAEECGTRRKCQNLLASALPPGTLIQPAGREFLPVGISDNFPQTRRRLLPASGRHVSPATRGGLDAAT